MLHEEMKRSEDQAKEKAEAEKQAAKEEEEKRTAQAERDKLKTLLTDEPKEGNSVNIGFRLPDGTKLVRNFRPNEPIKYMLAFILSKEIESLGHDPELLYNYPPQKILDIDMNKTFEEFFEGSTRELITVHESTS